MAWRPVPPPEDDEQAVRENLETWDSMAHMHAQGSGAGFYRIEQWLAGESKLGPWEIEEIGPVEGKSLLHLQCHIGTDSLSWAREGARVTGLDFSPNAIEEARRFAGILGFDDARFVVSSVSDAVDALEGDEFPALHMEGVASPTRGCAPSARDATRGAPTTGTPLALNTDGAARRLPQVPL